MLVQYLVTVVKKSETEIKQILDSLNLRGDILVGNQLMPTDNCYAISCNYYNAKIFNMTSCGVSKNRNFLLQHASADYVVFLDDDIYYLPDCQEKVEEEVRLSNNNCIRFNIASDNKDRPIRFLNKKGYVGFNRLSSFGVCGCFFKRDFLLSNNLLFNEEIGPGTGINHGEDTVFLKSFLKYSKVYSMPLVSFRAKQTNSTWRGENRKLEVELYSHGYVYYLLFGKLANLRSVVFLATHMKSYPKGTKYSTLRKYIKSGIEKAIKDSNNS